ncbi:cupin domain-containing protein [[Eubacterium] cellulosolvens]
MIPIIDLANNINEIHEPWSPIEVGRVNDQVVRMVLFQGEYHWHKHSDQDELFYVIRGEISIQLKDHLTITLRIEQMVVIPQGVKHCSNSLEPSYILMFEPQTLCARCWSVLKNR